MGANATRAYYHKVVHKLPRHTCKHKVFAVRTHAHVSSFDCQLWMVDGLAGCTLCVNTQQLTRCTLLASELLQLGLWVKYWWVLNGGVVLLVLDCSLLLLGDSVRLQEQTQSQACGPHDGAIIIGSGFCTHTANAAAANSPPPCCVCPAGIWDSLCSETYPYMSQRAQLLLLAWCWATGCPTPLISRLSRRFSGC